MNATGWRASTSTFNNAGDVVSVRLTRHDDDGVTKLNAVELAKGMLEDAGFAWKVTGSIQGYSANTVATQYPSAGTKVVDNGMPTVRVTLARNTHYPQKGNPENVSVVAPETVTPPSKPMPLVEVYTL